MRLAPFHDLDQFGPVIDFLKVEFLDGSSGDYHAVEILFGNLGESLVELKEMFCWSMCRLVCLGKQKLDVDLDRRI